MSAGALRIGRKGRRGSKQLAVEQTADSSADRFGKRIALSGIALGVLGLLYALDSILPGPEGSRRSYSDGISYFNDRKDDDARQAFDRAIELNPTFYQAYFERARLNTRVGQFDEAIADYGSVIRLKPDYADAFFNRALIRVDLGDPEHAIADFKEYVRFKPSEADGHRWIAEIAAGIGDFQQALDQRDALIALSSRYAPNYIDRALLHRDFGDLDGAMADLDAALEIAPTDAGVHLARGRLWRDKGDLKRAAAEFARAIELKPDDLRPHLARVEALRDIGQTDAARAELEDALKRAPPNATVYFQRGLITLFVLGDAAAAVSDLDAAVSKAYEYRDYAQLLGAGLSYVGGQDRIAVTPSTSSPQLATNVPFYPTIYAFVATRRLAHLQTGQREDSEFEKQKASLGVDSWDEPDLAMLPFRVAYRHRVAWPAQIFALFAGRASPETLHRAAEATPAPFERRMRLCQADFYAGEYQLQKGAREEAARLLQSAIDGCPAAAPEATFARLEFARLGVSAQSR